MAEMVIGEKVTLDEMGGAECTARVSGCGEVLVSDERACMEAARRYLAFMPARAARSAARADPRAPVPARGSDDASCRRIRTRPSNVHEIIDALVRRGQLLRGQALFARELVTGLARLDGHAVGIVASQRSGKGGVLFVDSDEKAAGRLAVRCVRAPAAVLADVPGFMIGKAVERQGMNRHGAR